MAGMLTRPVGMTVSMSVPLYRQGTQTDHWNYFSAAELRDASLLTMTLLNRVFAGLVVVSTCMSSVP